MIKCPSCDGLGCESCDDGSIVVDDCPHKIVTRDVWDLMSYADLYKRGTPPVQGGALDQCQSFNAGCRYVWSEQQTWKNKLGSLDFS